MTLCMSYTPPRVNSSFFAFPSTPAEVKKIIMSLPNKSCNINTVPVFIYKKRSLYLSPIICNIFNTSFIVQELAIKKRHQAYRIAAIVHIARLKPKS